MSSEEAAENFMMRLIICNIFFTKYRVHHLKSNPTTITYYGIKMKSEAGPPPCNRLSGSPS
jgi:hypothetical protein